MQRKLDIIRLIVHSPALPSLPAEAFLICQGRKKTAAQVPDSQQQSKASLIGTGLSHVFVVDVSGDPLNPHSKTTRWLSIQLSFLSQLRSLFKLLGLVLLSATYRPVGAKRSDSRADERSFPYKRGPRKPPGPAVLPRASSASENPLFSLSSPLRSIRSLISGKHLIFTIIILIPDFADCGSFARYRITTRGWSFLTSAACQPFVCQSNALKQPQTSFSGGETDSYSIFS